MLVYCNKRRSQLLLITSFFLSMANMFAMMWHNFSTVGQVNQVLRQDNSGQVIKKILLWNLPKRPETLLFGAGRQVFQQHGCEVTDCELVLSRGQLPFRDYPINSYDAIVFNFISSYSFGQLPKPEERNSSQRYVFFTQESPGVLNNLDQMIQKNKFNWTMTYRRNADIPLLYGRISPKKSAPKTSDRAAQLIEAFRHQPLSTNKTKLVAWMVSKCTTYSKREKYVKELKKYIHVDTYGKCGKLRCDPDELTSSHPKCYDMLESNYKFYLSFENSICKDYVTEKFFNVMSRNIVPVVFGGANYSRIAPPHSFIDARKFEPHQLAKYLKTLDANDTLYNQYFWWKEHYTVESGVVQMARHGFCDLCKKLHEDKRIKTHSTKSIVSQWKPLLACRDHVALYML